MSRGEVVGIGVDIVAVPRLARAAMAAPVMGDAAIAVRGEEEHLVLEGVGAERPAMAEDDRLSRAPILVIDLGAVLGRDRAHDASLRCSSLSGDDGGSRVAVMTTQNCRSEAGRRFRPEARTARCGQKEWRRLERNPGPAHALSRRGIGASATICPAAACDDGMVATAAPGPAVRATLFRRVPGASSRRPAGRPYFPCIAASYCFLIVSIFFSISGYFLIAASSFPRSFLMASCSVFQAP